MTKRKLSILLAFGMLYMLVSCGGNEVLDAENSLEGIWLVGDIYTRSGQQLANGQTTDFDTLETGNTGFFEFMADGTGAFNYISLGEPALLAARWDLKKAEINCGFTKCDEYTLSIGATDFICLFGDGTSDAHINATKLLLTNTIVENSMYTEKQIELIKN